MAHSIQTSDFTAISIYFSNSNLKESLSNVLNNLNKWQVNKQRIFGVSEYDFQGAFTQLLFREGLFASQSDFNGYSLIDTISLMLKYNDIYFNDEGEHWNDLEKPVSNSFTNKLLLLISQGKKDEVNIKQLLKGYKINEKFLISHSVPYRIFEKKDDSK